MASLVAEHGLWSASVVEACRLSCPLACGIFPDQGLNQCSLHWQADSLPLGHKESPGVNSCQEESSQTISSIPVTTLTFTTGVFAFCFCLAFDFISLKFYFILFYFFNYIYFFLFVVNFVIHWNEKVLGSHVFPIPINILSSITFHISHLCAFKSLHEDKFLILFQEK